jgi:7-cyano-7-deazaguanine synthase
MSSKVLVVMSGGLDSTTMAYDLESQGWTVEAISFDYGQRHAQSELACAQWHARQQQWEHDIIRMREMQEHLVSALTGAGPVPEGHYAADTMKATIVPNRNAIMMSIATGIAVSRDIPFIATAVHGGDHFIYPDCRGDFITALSVAFRLGNEGFLGIQAPYVGVDKNFIAQRAVDLDYNYEKTWSCYKGGQKHCGRCGTCVERMEAIWSTTASAHLHPSHDRAEVLFPPELYEDNTYWIQALQEARA